MLNSMRSSTSVDERAAEDLFQEMDSAADVTLLRIIVSLA